MYTEDLYRLLRTGHIQAQGIVDTISDPMLVLDENLRILNASRAFIDIFKVHRDETIGAYFYELGGGQWDIPALRLLLSAVIPKSAAVIDFEVEAAFPGLGLRKMLLTARMLHHPDRASHSLLLSIVDATERLRGDAAREMLYGEARHRMKNLLTITQSIARHTSTKGRTAEQYRDDFMGRFNALVEAQNTTFSASGGAELRDLLQRLLAPYTVMGETLEIQPSPDVALTSEQATSFGLVIHELATNAAKYGALADPHGRVRVSWSREEADDVLRFRWAESGGPEVKPPTETGFGAQLIHFVTTKSLAGRIEQKFLLEGFEAEIVMPLGGGPLGPSD